MFFPIMESSEIKKISPQQMIVVNSQALEHHYYTFTLHAYSIC